MNPGWKSVNVGKKQANLATDLTSGGQLGGETLEANPYRIFQNLGKSLKYTIGYEYERDWGGAFKSPFSKGGFRGIIKGLCNPPCPPLGKGGDASLLTCTAGRFKMMSKTGFEMTYSIGRDFTESTFFSSYLIMPGKYHSQAIGAAFFPSFR